jgi:hypothetical protein
MGRPITVRHTGSEGDLCDSLHGRRLVGVGGDDRNQAKGAARGQASVSDVRLPSGMDRGGQRVAAACSRMQERDALRSRAGDARCSSRACVSSRGPFALASAGAQEREGFRGIAAEDLRRVARPDHARRRLARRRDRRRRTSRRATRAHFVQRLRSSAPSRTTRSHVVPRARADRRGFETLAPQGRLGAIARWIERGAR